jgi:hypothetical protein
MKTIRRQILEFISYELELDIDKDEVREFERSLNSDNDFWIEIDGQEFRVINDQVIWDIYVDEIKNITEECYDVKAPSWLAIDWETTAENCFVDGYGHTFSYYDGSELECQFDEENYFIFRTN